MKSIRTGAAEIYAAAQRWVTAALRKMTPSSPPAAASGRPRTSRSSAPGSRTRTYRRTPSC